MPYDPQTPILLILSGHISGTDRLYALLAELQPLKMYIYLLGVSKEALRGKISWPCAVKFKQDTVGQGKDRALVAANKWFFRHEIEGIVLNCSNDWGCLPSSDFFGFCTELLEKYRTDERIGHISFGMIMQSSSPEDASYTFSRVPDLSFYATWQRVWQNFDAKLKTFRAFKKSKLLDKDPVYRDFTPHWHTVLTGKEFPGAVQYEYILLVNNCLCITPTNLWIDRPDRLTANPSKKNIIHPNFVIGDSETVLNAREIQFGMPFKRLFNDAGSSFLEDRLAALTKVAGRAMRIPRIIHHVCDYPNGIPENLLALAATWKKHHPDWEQRFWDRRQMEEFVHTVCPDFEPCYRTFPHNVQRWDAIRYLILYHIGGMYVDLDYECFRPFDAVLSGRNCYVATEPALHADFNEVPVMLNNALMAAVPGDKFMAKVIDELKNLSLDSFAHMERWRFVLQTTGPLMLTRIYESLTHKKRVTLLPDELFMPLTPKELTLAMNGKATKYINHKLSHAFAVHYFLSSW